MRKNLLFDLGGVIVDIKRQNCVDAFIRLGLTGANDYLGEYAQKGFFMEVEDGTITADGFRSAVRALIPRQVTDDQIDDAFQAFITGIPLSRLEALRRLRKSYKLYLLSNTNPIMWNGILAREFRKEGLRREDYFDGMVTSFEAKAAKPDRKIFDYAVSKLGISPADTTFFDDSQVNIDAARALGFEGILVPPGTEFTHFFE